MDGGTYSYFSPSVGNEVSCVIFGINNGLLSDGNTLERLSTKLLEEMNFQILEKNVHQFQPQGVTITYTLGESHLAMHTYPEDGRQALYWNLYSCRGKSDSKKSLEKFLELLEIENKAPCRVTQLKDVPVFIDEYSLVNSLE